MTPDSLFTALAEAVGPQALLTDPHDRAPFEREWRQAYPGRARAVVRPDSTEAVARVVRICRAHGVPLVPQGGNTGLVGGSTPDDSGTEVVLSLTRMARIRAISPLDNAITVEAGCILRNVQEAADRHDRLFPLSLAAEGSATIGGNLSTNAGGEQVLRYGNTRDLTLGLEVVLPDGRIWNGLSPLRKDNTGYDLKQWFIGAEGTLGIITAATLKLFPRPARQGTLWAALEEPGQAVALLALLRARLGDRVTAFELIGHEALAQTLAHIDGARAPLATATPWSVLAEVSETAPDIDLDAQLESALEAAFEQGLVADAVVAQSGQQAESLWHIRDHIPEAQRHEGPSIKHDISVPVSRIPDFIDQAGTALRAAFPGIRIVCFGHVGDGNLHYNQSAAPGQDPGAFVAQADAIHDIVHAVAARLDGSISAEHGIGRLKQDALLRHKDPVALDLMRALKHTLDPDNLFNPGRVLPLSFLSSQDQP